MNYADTAADKGSMQEQKYLAMVAKLSQKETKQTRILFVEYRDFSST